MISNYHTHTTRCRHAFGEDEEYVLAALDRRLQILGFADHSPYIFPGDYYSNMRMPMNELEDYVSSVLSLREKYADKIRILRGIEVATLYGSRYALPDSADISFFDYCLIENLDHFDTSIAQGDLFAFAKRCGCPVGVAHTDMFAFIEKLGEKPEDYFRRMAEENIFWEMNVSYDSIHNYREHAYMLEFFRNQEQQKIVRESGVRLSVGFDGHRVKDYLPERVADYCKRITDMGIKLAFE